MKKIYFVATTVPGNVGGAPIRNYNLIKQLAGIHLENSPRTDSKQLDVEIEVFCIAADSEKTIGKETEPKTKAMYRIFPFVARSSAGMMRALLLERIPPDMSEAKRSGIGDAFRKACEESLPDIVHIEQIHGYYCIREHVSWLKSHGVKIVFDCHNVEWQSFEDAAELLSPFKRMVARSLVSRLKKMEIEAATQADIVLACSEPDADFFQKYNPKTYVIPNGVDCEEFKPVTKARTHVENSFLQNSSIEPILIFIGGVKYSPNADGLRFYLESVHPKIKENFPNVRLLAIGADKAWLRAAGLEDASIEALGFVPDVQPYLDKANIGICPIRRGAGTRIKIMTYMAAGLPVVSTTKGAEGVDYTDGRDIMLADDPEKFAGATVELLKNKARYDAVARDGRNFILENYDWNVIGNKLRIAYNDGLSLGKI